MGFATRNINADPDEALALYRGADLPLLLVRRHDLTAAVLRDASDRSKHWPGLDQSRPKRSGGKAKRALFRNWLVGTLQNATSRPAI